MKHFAPPISCIQNFLFYNSIMIHLIQHSKDTNFPCVMVCLCGRPFCMAPLERNDTQSQAHRKTLPPCCQHVLLSTQQFRRLSFKSQHRIFLSCIWPTISPRFVALAQNYGKLYPLKAQWALGWTWYATWPPEIVLMLQQKPVTRVISSSHSHDCLNIARIQRHQKEDNSEVEEFTT